MSAGQLYSEYMINFPDSILRTIRTPVPSDLRITTPLTGEEGYCDDFDVGSMSQLDQIGWFCSLLVNYVHEHGDASTIPVTRVGNNRLLPAPPQFDFDNWWRMIREHPMDQLADLWDLNDDEDFFWLFTHLRNNQGELMPITMGILHAVVDFDCPFVLQALLTEGRLVITREIAIELGLFAAGRRGYIGLSMLRVFANEGRVDFSSQSDEDLLGLVGDLMRGDSDVPRRSASIRREIRRILGR